MSDGKGPTSMQPQPPQAPAPPPYPQPAAENLGYVPPANLPQQPQVFPQVQSEAARLGEQYRAELMAQCALGHHDRTTKYGVCGIITAVVCFPIGLIALFIDTEDRCARCGIRL